MGVPAPSEVEDELSEVVVVVPETEADDAEESDGDADDTEE